MKRKRISLIVTMTAIIIASCTQHQEEEVLQPPSLDINGHKFIDLSLPSGTIWAMYNIGAHSALDYGYFFQWGSTTPINDPISGYKSFGKYYNDSLEGFVKYTPSDSLLTLLQADDAASAIYGGDWELPTEAQFQELFDNTTQQWISTDKISGMKFTSKKNGRYLFLPACGIIEKDHPVFIGNIGVYWTKDIDTLSYRSARVGAFTTAHRKMFRNLHNLSSNGREFGCPIRPVIAK